MFLPQLVVQKLLLLLHLQLLLHLLRYLLRLLLQNVLRHLLLMRPYLLLLRSLSCRDETTQSFSRPAPCVMHFRCAGVCLLMALQTLRQDRKPASGVCLL